MADDDSFFGKILGPLGDIGGIAELLHLIGFNFSKSDKEKSSHNKQEEATLDKRTVLLGWIFSKQTKQEVMEAYLKKEQHFKNAKAPLPNENLFNSLLASHFEEVVRRNSEKDGTIKWLGVEEDMKKVLIDLSDDDFLLFLEGKNNDFIRQEAIRIKDEALNIAKNNPIVRTVLDTNNDAFVRSIEKMRRNKILISPKDEDRYQKILSERGVS